MKNKKMYLGVLAFIAIICVVSYVIVNTNNNSNIYSISTIKNLKESDIKAKYVFTKNITATDIEGNFDTKYVIELDLYKGNIFHVKTKAGEQAIDENCYGTYEIKDEILTINRKTTVDLDNNYEDINSSSNYSLSDSFKISNNKKTLTTKVYNGLDSTYTSSKYFNDSVILEKK